MYTVKDIAHILKELVIKTENLNDAVISDFEFQYRLINHVNTAFISISKATWTHWLGKPPKISSGNDQLKQNYLRPSLIITDDFIADLEPSIPQILVEDAIEAMQVLGIYFRSQFHNTVIAVTGSMGKSSTRMMIGESLREYQVLQNRGNANTRVPTLLNLCKLIKNPDFAVFEMSINAINNKGNLSLIVNPHYTIVTGIGEAHLSTIRSTEDIAQFKSRIFAGQSKNGIAIVNAIEAFNKQSQFYTGNKIIVLGKISDLGSESEKLHLQLVGKLEQSNADYILCMDPEMRKVVNRVKYKSITWYNDSELLLHDLLYLVNEDGLTLLKSSVTGTELPKIATRLFEHLQNEYIELKEKQYIHHFPIEKTYAYLNQNGKVENNAYVNTPISIEGITPLIYYIYSQKKRMVNRKIFLKKWPTNNEIYFTGKEIELTDLIMAMIKKPHPSLIYQLAYELFSNEMERRKYVSTFIEEHRLSPSSSVNVTGRFRLKERQSFTVADLVKIYKTYSSILFKDTNDVIFGDKYYHGMIKGVRDNILVFAMYESLETLISELL
ncbi:hypothetical protein K0T63_001169 [Staphylococcus pseudintermedius]|nr:hypothetical protein [Staphylococcus pseudintermedius]